MAASQPRLCGICYALDHPIDACSTLQEIEQAANVSAMQPGQSFRPQQQHCNLYSNTCNHGWRNHPNLRYGPGPQQQKPFKQQQFQPSTSKYQAPPFGEQQQ